MKKFTAIGMIVLLIAFICVSAFKTIDYYSHRNKAYWNSYDEFSQQVFLVDTIETELMHKTVKQIICYSITVQDIIKTELVGSRDSVLVYFDERNAEIAFRKIEYNGNFLMLN